MKVSEFVTSLFKMSHICISAYYCDNNYDCVQIIKLDCSHLPVHFLGKTINLITFNSVSWCGPCGQMVKSTNC